jgi:hypothetical protein
MTTPGSSSWMWWPVWSAVTRWEVHDDPGGRGRRLEGAADWKTGTVNVTSSNELDRDVIEAADEDRYQHVD